jgi:hypothetical protein
MIIFSEVIAQDGFVFRHRIASLSIVYSARATT